MGWLGGFLKRVGGAAPEEMVFAPSVAAPALPGIGEPIVADECYVELFVESLRLTEARRFASRFNGVVYSFVTLAREGEANAQLAAVSKPDKLTEIDDTSLDKVITVSKQMMAAVPWRGGALEPRDRSLLGQDRKPAVADPGLRHPCLVGGRHQLCRRSEAVSPAHHRRHGPDHRPARGHGGRGRPRHRPRAPPERGAGNRRRAEGQRRRGEALARRRPPAAPRWSSSRSAATACSPFDGRQQKADFGEIPELKEKYATLQAAIRANKAADARDAMTAFRLATIASPDSDLLRRAPPGREGAAETGCGVRVDRRRGRARRAQAAPRRGACRHRAVSLAGVCGRRRRRAWLAEAGRNRSQA